MNARAAAAAAATIAAALRIHISGIPADPGVTAWQWADGITIGPTRDTCVNVPWDSQPYRQPPASR